MIAAIMNDNDCLAVGSPVCDGVVTLFQSEMSLIEEARPPRFEIGNVSSAVPAILQECEPLAIRSYVCISYTQSSPACDLTRLLRWPTSVRVKPHCPVVAVVPDSVGFSHRIDQPSIGQPGKITCYLLRFGGCEHCDGRPAM